MEDDLTNFNKMIACMHLCFLSNSPEISRIKIIFFAKLQLVWKMSLVKKKSLKKWSGEELKYMQISTSFEYDHSELLQIISLSMNWPN